MPGARSIAAAALAALLVVAWALPVTAERLPVRRYSTAEGLSGDFVIDLYRDSRGFLWFSTRDGLSRFDGLRFTSYGLSDGLPRATVNAVLETRDGAYWIATNGGGVCRFQPDSLPRFVPSPIGAEAATNRVNVLFEDRAGRLWVGTDNGVFAREPGDDAFRPVDLSLPADVSAHGVNDILEDAEGSVWVSGGFGVRRRLPDRRVVSYRVDPSGPRDSVTAMLLTAEQRLWVGFRRGLVSFQPDPVERFTGETAPLERVIAAGARETRAVPRAIRWYGRDDGLPDSIVTALHQSADGHLWVGTTSGVADFSDNRFHAYPASSGLPGTIVSDMADDEAGNLWIATVSGAVRLVRRGLVTYGEADGLGDSQVHAIGEDPDGALVAVTGDFQLNRFDGQRFESVRLAVPADAVCAWMSPCGYVDPHGAWWILTTTGLYRWAAGTRFSDLRERQADVVVTARQGLLDDSVFAAFADSQGRIWVSAVTGGVSVWDPADRGWHTFSEADGLPPAGRMVGRANVFAEDHSGAIWIGFDGDGLARRRNGRFEPFNAADGVSATTVTALHVDAAGRLWIGSNQAGLSRIDDPTAGRVTVRPFTTAEGLASDNVRTIVEDDRGRIYAGTSQGVDRIDPETGAMSHFSVGEGLASQFVTASFRDRRGALWFGTVSGLSRLDPAAESAGPVGPVPAVLISGVRVAGVPRPVSELGEGAPAAFEVSPADNRLEIEYFALNVGGGALRYQYRLEGANEDWSLPTALQSVNYARLAPGRYRFLVRAIRADGTASARPAVVTFRMLPPFYATWWFLATAIVVAGGIAASAHRVRVRQLLRVERVRARIATDLHDDLGASLSQIAILAEVARTRAGAQPSGAAADPLARIAETSRSLVDSMSDIVWAINPSVDTLSDLVHRMRRFVEDTVGSTDIDVTFSAPDPAPDLKLGADVRREVLLVLKESVTNIAKHAACRRVVIDLGLTRRRLHLLVQDDGRGFDPDAPTDGNGVASLRRRLVSLGGHLRIDSAPGRGTTIQLDLDLSRASDAPGAGNYVRG